MKFEPKVQIKREIAKKKPKKFKKSLEMVKEETAPEGTVSSGLLFKMIGLFHQFLGDFTADGALEVDAGGGSAEKEIAEQAARVEMSNAFFIGCSFCEVFAAKLNIFL